MTATARGGVAIVTGGSRGIGAATAVRLAQGGWDVCIGYVSDAEAAAEVAEVCRLADQQAVTVRGDVGSADGIRALFEAADSFGTLGVLVNNAALLSPPQRLEDMDAAGLERIFAVNAIGPLLCAREAATRMRRHGTAGSIVNVSSVASCHGGAGGYINYAATKGALESMTIGLAKELAPAGIRVNCVRPGAVDTDMQAAAGPPQEGGQNATAAALGRAGRPEEIADAIAWLCSAEASYVVGAIVDVTGGR